MFEHPVHLESRTLGAIIALSDMMCKHVDTNFSLIYFDLIDRCQVITNVEILKQKSVMLDLLEEFILVDDEDLHSFTEDEDNRISEELVKLLNKIPSTYFQVITLEGLISFRYYSSVNNTREHIRKILKGFKSKVEEDKLYGVVLPNLLSE